MMDAGYICSDQSRGVGKTLYVSHIRGNGGKDWGYSPDVATAVRLTDRMASIYVNELGVNSGRSRHE